MPQSEGLPDPDTKHGLSYWAEQSADYDGVLGSSLISCRPVGMALIELLQADSAMG
jgi:hypothetical protein